MSSSFGPKISSCLSALVALTKGIACRKCEHRFALFMAERVFINPFTAMMSFEKWSIKVPNLKLLSLFVFFFALACEERIFSKTRSFERCYRTGTFSVCRRIRSSFSPDILQVGAVKGLIICCVGSFVCRGIRSWWTRRSLPIWSL